MRQLASFDRNITKCNKNNVSKKKIRFSKKREIRQFCDCVLRTTVVFSLFFQQINTEKAVESILYGQKTNKYISYKSKNISRLLQYAMKDKYKEQ